MSSIKEPRIKKLVVSTKFLMVLLAFILSVSSMGTVFADDANDPSIETAQEEEISTGVEELYDQLIGSLIDPLASTYPYYVIYDQIPNSTIVKVTLPNLDALMMLGSVGSVDSVVIEASMNYQGVITRNPKLTQNLTALQTTGATSFDMDFGDFGRFIVEAKFYKGTTLVATGDTVTVGITAKEYNIAPLSGTLPTLFYAISMFGSNSIRYSSNGDLIPTVLLMERPNGYDWENLPEGVYGLPYLSKADVTFQPGDFNLASTRFRDFTPVFEDYVADLYMMDPTAKFNLYVADFYLGLIHTVLYANRIPQDQYTINVLTDGVFSTNKFNEVYSGSNPDTTHNTLITQWNAAKTQAYASGQVSSSFTLGNCNNYSYAAVCAEPNATWWLTRVSDTIFSGDGNAFANTAKTNPKLLIFNIVNQLNLLSGTEQAELKVLFKFADTYFADALQNNKEILILLGTRADVESGFVDYSRLTMAFYGDQYEYYYKGHPGTPTGAFPGKQEDLDTLGVIDLDSSIPAELFLFYVPEVNLAGYTSSTYASVPIGMGKFMFQMTKAQGMANPLYVNMDAWISPVTTSSPTAIQDLCQIGHRNYLVEFSDAFIASINNEYTHAIWDASDFTITYYHYNGSVYIFVKTEEASFDVISEGLFTIRPKTNPGLSIDVAGATHANGGVIQAYTYNYTQAQTFRFIAAGDGYYYIQCVASGKMIDVAGAGTTPGTTVHQWEANDTVAQKWKPVQTGDSDGSFYLVSACNDLYLDMKGAGSTSGTVLWAYTGNNTIAQKFYLDKITANIPEGLYTFASYVPQDPGSTTRMVLDIAGGSVINGGNAQIWEDNGTGAQKFELLYNPHTGYYNIVNLKSGLYLDVNGANAAAGTNVHQYKSNGTVAQMWRILKNGDGSYTFVSATGIGCCLDVSGAQSTNGTNVLIYYSNGTVAQRWDFVPIPY